jgi:ribokinase
MLTVFGSINLDIGLRVARLPAPGETLLGREARFSPGGKGANQAHAARLFGVETALVGAVGEDELAGMACALLEASGVDLGGVRRVGAETTGLATIHVSDDGENSIVVAPGANTALRADWADDALLRRSSGLVLQMEVPAVESMAVARRARAFGSRVTLNLAPALSLEGVAFDAIDTLVVNETELASAASLSGSGGAGISEQVERLSRHWRIDVIATLGAKGALFHGRDGSRVEQAARVVRVVDTTGAGDTFTGVFAAAVDEGAMPEAALRLAVTAAGLACERRGAQSSQPTRAQVMDAIG